MKTSLLTSTLMLVALVPLIKAPQADAAITDGLVGHWSFDTGGDLGDDSTANNNDGVLVNSSGTPSATTGILSGGINFSGVSGFVSVPDSSSLDSATGSGQARTVAFWFKTTTTGNTVIAEKGTNKHFVVQTAGSQPGGMQWRVTTSGSNAVTPTDFNDDQWHHFVGVHNGTSNRILIDGVLQVGSNSTAAPGDDGDPLVFGARAGGLFSYPGQLDDAGIWNRELNLPEVLGLYQSGSPSSNISAATEVAVSLLPGEITGVTYAYTDPAAESQPSSFNSTYLDAGNTKLTDRLTSLGNSEAFQDNSWAGFRDEAPDSTGPQPEITFDLGSVTNLDDMIITYLAGDSAGINAPDSLNVLVSDDGSLFTPALTGAMPFDPTGGALFVDDVTIDLSGFSGQFVRLQFFNDTQWTFLGEVTFTADLAIPEPASIAIWSLIGLGLCGYGIARRRRTR